MPMINRFAGSQIAAERGARGHSPESLADEIREAAVTAPWGSRGAVDAHTIRQVEKGHVPGTRVQFVLARHLFGKRPEEIWNPEHAVEVPRRTGAFA